MGPASPACSRNPGASESLRHRLVLEPEGKMEPVGDTDVTATHQDACSDGTFIAENWVELSRSNALTPGSLLLWQLLGSR